jgi:hypothetical protein
MVAVALVVLAVSVGWAVTGWQTRSAARREAAAMQTAVRVAQRDSAVLGARLAHAQATLERLGTEADVMTQAQLVSGLDQQELDLVKDALRAGLAGDAVAYNRDVTGRNRLDVSHDAVVQALQPTIAVVSAQLATL